MTFIEQFERALTRMLDSGSADTAKRPGASRRSGLHGTAAK